MSRKVLTVEVTRRSDGKMLTELRATNLSYEQFGLALVDILRHGAKAYNVSEEAIWEWVEREYYNPTTPVIEIKPN
jgi:hypothetical protein